MFHLTVPLNKLCIHLLDVPLKKEKRGMRSTNCVLGNHSNRSGEWCK